MNKDTKSIEKLQGELRDVRRQCKELKKANVKYKGIEKELQEYTAIYRAIVEAFDGLIYLCSEDYKVKAMNKQFQGLLGHDPIGKKCHKALHNLDKICPWCVNDKVFQGKIVRSEILSPRNKRYYSVVNAPVFHPDGSVSKMAMFHDITEQKNAQERSKKMERVLLTDELTGLMNRRSLFEKANEEITRAKRQSHPTSLMMIDVDDFKWFNDKNGHLAGDKALRNLAALLRNTTRNIDFVGRYGGEEFTVILPNTSKAKATAIGDRLQKEVERFKFSYQENQPLGNFTISIGLAAYPDDATDVDTLIEAADTALYQAKSAGKNRLVQFNKPCKSFEDSKGSP